MRDDQPVVSAASWIVSASIYDGRLANLDNVVSRFGARLPRRPLALREALARRRDLPLALLRARVGDGLLRRAPALGRARERGGLRDQSSVGHYGVTPPNSSSRNFMS